MRGGHQMCIDPYTNTIYLFGGWDGNKDLNDLWSYDVKKQTWTLICADASSEKGPSPRSCHKMCLDTKKKQIFMLGRYLDVQYRSMDTLQVRFIRDGQKIPSLLLNPVFYYFRVIFTCTILKVISGF